MLSEKSLFSVEFFPPKTPAGANRLRRVRSELVGLSPQFFSVTFGAGGSAQSGTQAVIEAIVDEGKIDAVPHISCVGMKSEKLREIVDVYLALGVQRMVVLRGDDPENGSEERDFPYAANLVQFIRQLVPDSFQIIVAAYPECHPQSQTLDEDVRFFVDKVRAGADAAITQYFFNADAYWNFVDQVHKHGVDIPIIPGIMPITNVDSLLRFSRRCGADIPRWLEYHLMGLRHDPDAASKFGHELVCALCERLLAGGVKNLHFYALNQWRPVHLLCSSLGLGSETG